MQNNAQTALNQYQSTGNSSIAYADPHELIRRLMDGAIERIHQAKGAIQQGNPEAKAKLISKAIAIISGLDACLDRDRSNELMRNLEAIYEYMNMRLLEANVEDDIARLEEVARLMSEIKSAWIQIPEESKKSPTSRSAGNL